MDKSANQTMRKCRTHLMYNHPWVGSLSLRLTLRESTDMWAMATDGNNLYYNPQFVKSHSEQEVIGVIAHETLHCALLHVYRMGGIGNITRKKNIAADYVVNLIVGEMRLKLPSEALLDTQYRGMAYETVLSKLPPHPPEGGSGSGSGKGSGNAGTGQSGGDKWNVGDMQTPKGASASGSGDKSGGKNNSESDWKMYVNQATRACGAGSLPNSLRQLIDESQESVVDWRVRLQRFIHSVMDPHDYTLIRPNRRFIASGLYLPGVVKDGCGELVVFFDSSGSVFCDKTLVSQFAAECRTIMSDCRPERMHLIVVDTAVTDHLIFEPDGEPFSFSEVKGGGGTYFQPAFDYVRDKGIDCRCAVYLTDLENADTVTDPEYPVLWIVPAWQKDTFAFGETIRMVGSTESRGY